MKKRTIYYLITLVMLFSLIFLGYNYIEQEPVYNDINTTYENNLINKLAKLGEGNDKIQKIIDNYEEYPETLLYMLSNDLDMTDFVLDYPSKKGQVFSDDVGDITLDSVPLFLQWDERWGYGDYGKNTIVLSGCGPTSLAMVLVYLTKDKTLTPYKIAKMAEEKGYYVDNGGTTWDLMHYGSSNYGVHSKVLPLSKSVIVNALNNNHPVILNVGPGYFTSKGHYIVLTEVVDGLFKVNDPNSIKNSNKLWDYDDIKNQIKNIWEFYV